MGTARKWSKEDKDYTGVARSALIGSNNKSMSGADQTDQAISTYQPFVHNMKWYWPLFLYYLEVSLYNSWHYTAYLRKTGLSLNMYNQLQTPT